MRWTLPNILTLARICLTPVIALLPFIQGYWPKVIAFVIFLVAAFSDVIDGYLARRHNQISELGQLLDPIADKLLLFATLIPIFWLTRHPTILVDYRIPWWGSFPVWVALLLVGRELLMTAFRFFAKRRGHRDRRGHRSSAVIAAFAGIAALAAGLACLAPRAAAPGAPAGALADRGSSAASRGSRRRGGRARAPRRRRSPPAPPAWSPGTAAARRAR